jgi:hypothetical protein
MSAPLPTVTLEDGDELPQPWRNDDVAARYAKEPPALSVPDDPAGSASAMEWLVWNTNIVRFESLGLLAQARRLAARYLIRHRNEGPYVTEQRPDRVQADQAMFREIALQQQRLVTSLPRPARLRQSSESPVPVVGDSESADGRAQRLLQQRTDIGPTKKQALIDARHGLGIYRAQLDQLEKACRLTGIAAPSMLRASHIKPWRDADDREKLDGCNGLLLTPNAEYLFGRGYVSMADDGTLLVSRTVDGMTLRRLGLKRRHNVGTFRPEQCRYLAFHRDHVFIE